MNDSLLQLNLTTISCLLVIVLGTLAFLSLNRRRAEDVLGDLEEYLPELKNKGAPASKADLEREARDRKQREEFSFLSTLSVSERNKLRRQQLITIVIVAAAGTLLGLLFFRGRPFNCAALSLVGLCLGYLLAQRKLRVQEERFKKEIVFFLPVVMERVVMAVQSGLDIIPALKVIEEIERAGAQKGVSKSDVVTRLLAQVTSLCESGLSFEQALREVAGSVKSNPLRHSFIHLAVAQKEGGELVYPLRELSDATQLYFQESVEEEIAKMPVKATAPLLLTFAGLIVSFITGPVIQILNISVKPGDIGKAEQEQVREVANVDRR